MTIFVRLMTNILGPFGGWNVGIFKKFLSNYFPKIFLLYSTFFISIQMLGHFTQLFVDFLVLTQFPVHTIVWNHTLHAIFEIFLKLLLLQFWVSDSFNTIAWVGKHLNYVSPEIIILYCHTKLETPWYWKYVVPVQSCSS